MCTKVGVENINFDLATFIRTIVVVFILGLMVRGTRPVQNAAAISGRSYLFRLLSGLGNGALCSRALKIRQRLGSADRQRNFSLTTRLTATGRPWRQS